MYISSMGLGKLGLEEFMGDLANDLIAGPAVLLFRAMVPEQDPKFHVEDHDDIFGQIDQFRLFLKADLLLFQKIFRPFAFGIRTAISKKWRYSRSYPLLQYCLTLPETYSFGVHFSSGWSSIFARIIRTKSYGLSM